VSKGISGLVCLDVDDGEILWATRLPMAYDSALGALAIGSDGKVRVVRSLSSKHELYRLSRDGVIEDVALHPGFALYAVFDTHGVATVMTPDDLRQYAPNGTPGFSVPAGVSPIALGVSSADGLLLAGDDGNVWVVGPASGSGTSRWRLWAVGPDGRTRWTRDLQSVQFRRLQVRADALYGVGARDNSRGSDRSVEIVLERMNAASGAVTWTRASRHWPFTARGSDLAISPDGRELVLAHGEFDRMHLERLQTATGERVHESYAACGALCGIPAALAFDAAGTARIAVDVLDRDFGQTSAVIATDLSAVTTRLDQPGIAGAWWSPYANGEGITFDWLPASRTLFGAWFTYSTAGGNEPSELRWYSLQANGVADGTRRLELPILETTGGNFDAGPSVSPRRVGTAQLEFHDCTRGTVHYAFDAPVNEGRSGMITLSRLSPATQPCLLADGSTVPGTGAQPPANGFDAKLSGTWFDEATSGQGLQFTVQPQGVLFAPWFTFDPAAAGNDAGRQHWFTLQGNLAEARDGVAELVLVQTIGGTFDRVPTYNANAIGTATLRVQNCDRADLDYRFADAQITGAFRARSGTLRLTRAGGCAP